MTEEDYERRSKDRPFEQTYESKKLFEKDKEISEQLVYKSYGGFTTEFHQTVINRESEVPNLVYNLYRNDDGTFQSLT